MRVLVVASTFPASDSDSVPSFVRDQVIALKAQRPDIDFSVLAPHDQRSQTVSFRHHDAYDEYRFHYIWPFRFEKLAGRGIMPALAANPLNYLLVPFLFLGEFFALLQLTRRLQPDMLYCHWFTPQVVVAYPVSLLTKTPYVFTTHASDVAVWHKIPLIGAPIVRLATRRAKGFTAVSSRSMKKLENFFSEREWQQLKNRSRRIPMGVNLPDVSTSIASSASNKQSIVFVGRLAEKKGVQYLLPAFADIHTTNPDVQLVVAGDGPLLSSLRQQARSLGIEQSVSFPGYVSGVDKQALIRSATIFVVPSIIIASGDAEGLPVSLMEGLSYGKICVATYESGADDVLTDKKDGFLLHQKDSQQLSACLLAALNLSPDEHRAMVAHARQTAAQFSWADIAHQHDAFFFQPASKSART